MNKLGFGLMRLPLTDPEDPKSIDLPQLERMADRFLQRGGTYFDTAYPYHQGMSEVAFRKAVAERWPRAAYTVTDKLPLWKVERPEDQEAIFQEQLRRCGVEYFDYYWLHALSAGRYEHAEKMGSFAHLQKLKERGLVRHTGFSFHDSADVLERILTEHPEMEYVQLQLNYVDWDDDGVQGRACYETAVRHGKPVVVMEPVKGGLLARLPAEAEAIFRAAAPGASSASWAVRYGASLEQAMVVLSGMSDLAQMEDNLSYMEPFRPLSGEERGAVARVVQALRARPSIPCTGCRYCVDGCPEHIAIPEYFALYNEQSRFALTPGHAARYGELAAAHGRASACIACGQCAAQCPQHIDVPARLRQVAETFEK